MSKKPGALKVTQMPGTRQAPETVLAQALEDATAGKINSVTVVYEATDGRVYSVWSNMPASMLAFHLKCLDLDVAASMSSECDETCAPPYPA